MLRSLSIVIFSTYDLHLALLLRVEFSVSTINGDWKLARYRWNSEMLFEFYDIFDRKNQGLWLTVTIFSQVLEHIWEERINIYYFGIHCHEDGLVKMIPTKGKNLCEFQASFPLPRIMCGVHYLAIVLMGPFPDKTKTFAY